MKKLYAQHKAHFGELDLVELEKRFENKKNKEWMKIPKTENGRIATRYEMKSSHEDQRFTFTFLGSDGAKLKMFFACHITGTS